MSLGFFYDDSHVFLVTNKKFDEVFKWQGVVKPLWVLLVDGGPDENPRYLKNIHQYCRLFRHLDLDYFTIRTHAPGQSAYNPVERSMATLSKKVAGITLPIDHFGTHLDSQGKVRDRELGLRNFEYAGQALANLWRKDPIFGKPVLAEYIDRSKNPFADVIFPKIEGESQGYNEESEPLVPWSWIENHCLICQYSLDIRKCDDFSCCLPKRAEEAAALLSVNNGFLPPVIKGKDGHFLNAIHTLEYFDRIKIPGYDAHLSSLSADTHARRCCTTCNKYFPTVAFLTKHKKFAHPSPTRRRLNRLETNSAIIDDFSTLSSPFFEEVSVVIDYMSDGEIC